MPADEAPLSFESTGVQGLNHAQSEIGKAEQFSIKRLKTRPASKFSSSS